MFGNLKCFYLPNSKCRSHKIVTYVYWGKKSGIKKKKPPTMPKVFDSTVPGEVNDDRDNKPL